MNASWLWTGAIAAAVLAWLAVVILPQATQCGKSGGVMVEAMTTTGYACVSDASK